jgi:hypothetical protein
VELEGHLLHRPIAEHAGVGRSTDALGQGLVAADPGGHHVGVVGERRRQALERQAEEVRRLEGEGAEAVDAGVHQGGGGVGPVGRRHHQLGEPLVGASAQGEQQPVLRPEHAVDGPGRGAHGVGDGPDRHRVGPAGRHQGVGRAEQRRRRALVVLPGPAHP